MPGNVIKFECGYESDPGTPVSVSWYRGSNEILYEDRRIYVMPDHTLVINTTSEEDGGKSFVASYTCSVSNGIHVVNATAKLRPPDVEKEGLVQPSTQLGEGQGERFWCILLSYVNRIYSESINMLSFLCFLKFILHSIVSI